MMQAVTRGITSSSRASSSAASWYPYYKKVFIDMPNALRAGIQWRGKSVAASIPSDSSIPSKVRKRIPKHERRAMVEGFVEKYRATNAGKFPSASLTVQHIGGSFYVIREILQELEYKSKFSPVKGMEELPLDKVKVDTCTSSDARKESSLTETEESSVSVSVESCIYFEPSTIVASVSKEIIEDVKVDKAPTNVSDELSHLNSAHVSHGDASSSSKDSDVVNLPSSRAKSDIIQHMPKSFSEEPDDRGGDIDGLNQVEQKDGKEFLGTEELHRGITRKLEHEEASPKKSSLWGNLMSLAQDIVNFWKK